LQSYKQVIDTYIRVHTKVTSFSNWVQKCNLFWNTGL